MFGKKKVEDTPAVEVKKEKPTPAYLRDDYPYNAIGDAITDFEALEPNGVLYEIRCPKCEMSIRGQGLNIKSTYDHMIDGIEVTDKDGSTHIEGGKGCIICGNRDFVIRKIDTSRMSDVEKARKEKLEADK